MQLVPKDVLAHHIQRITQSNPFREGVIWGDVFHLGQFGNNYNMQIIT
jgi:hypothetical protein